MEKKHIQLFAFGTAFLMTVFSIGAYISFSHRMQAQNREHSAILSRQAEAEDRAQKEIVRAAKREEIFSALPLHARAVYVLDGWNGETLYAKDAETPYPLASLTKVMTALVVSELPQDTVIPITEEAFSFAESATSGPLLLGERWHMRDLLSYTLLVSSNEGAEALALAGGAFSETAEKDPKKNFIRKMNETARRLSLGDTKFYNSSGLDITNGKSGGYGSAKDVAQLFRYVLKEEPEIFSGTALSRDIFYSVEGTRHRADNTNILAGKIPGLLAGKTGYTDLAGGNLAFAFNAGPLRPIIIAILGSTKEGRFEDAEKLVWASIRAIGVE